MKYPTINEVENADRVQLARWWRFLPLAGHCLIKEDQEIATMNYIMYRFNEMGGFTPEISKQIGWD
jgi:hypothetical protein